MVTTEEQIIEAQHTAKKLDRELSQLADRTTEESLSASLSSVRRFLLDVNGCLRSIVAQFEDVAGKKDDESA